MRHKEKQNKQHPLTMQVAILRLEADYDFSTLFETLKKRLGINVKLNYL